MTDGQTELPTIDLLILQEILAYRERVKALAMKLEQFDGISSIVEELQRKVSSGTKIRW